MQFECIDANEKGGPNHIFGPNHNITYVAHRGGGRGGGRDCNTRPQFTSCGNGFGQVSHNYHNSGLGTPPRGPLPPPPHHMLTLLGLAPNGGH